MKKQFDNKTLASVAAVLLAGVGIGAYLGYDYLIQKNQELQQQLEILTKEEQRSTVMQRVNAQMEEIANEERRISDEQREAAEEQTKVAEQERQNAEQQRHKAEEERQNALIAEQKAVEASRIAKNQQAIAEQERAQAEYSKRVADTLSFITLARSMGAMATNQLQAGNSNLANMLAYMSYRLTVRYDGDIYYPAIYQALVATSQSKQTWNKHKGAISSVEFYPGQAVKSISASTYGEVMNHTMNGNDIESKTIFRDNQYDFRDVFVHSNGNVFVTARNGQVHIFKDDKLVTTLTPNIQDKLLGCTNLGNQMVCIGERTISLIDPNAKTILDTKSLESRITTFSRYDNCPILFDNQGKQHIIKSFNHIESSRVPFNGQVTAFASSKNTKMVAYGMQDGTIYLNTAKMKGIKLVGHRSRVTKIKINGWRIYSSSYDGNLILWMGDQEKIEPITLFTINSWILDFTFDNKKNNIWAGDQRGNLTQAYISVPIMVGKLKGKLKRNFTRDEWDYYIGNNVPYENIIDK